MGMIGISLATAMTVLSFLAAVDATKRSAAFEQTDAGIAFAIVPLSGIVFFAVMVALAIAAIRRPETTNGRCCWPASPSWMPPWRAGF